MAAERYFDCSIPVFKQTHKQQRDPTIFAGGAVFNSYDYDAYGRIESMVQGVANPFTYTGREFDSESGLYYHRARYYDPNDGRFITRDPIGLRGGDPNVYRYVAGNPVNSVDVFGLISIEPLSCLAVLGIGAGAAVIAGGVTAYLVKDEKPTPSQAVDNAVSAFVPVRPSDVVELANILDETTCDIEYKKR